MPAQQEKLENASSRIGKLLTEQAALINEGSLDAAAAHTQFVPAALEILSDEGVPKEVWAGEAVQCLCAYIHPSLGHVVLLYGMRWSMCIGAWCTRAGHHNDDAHSFVC